jgi:hypothetical protein
MLEGLEIKAFGDASISPKQSENPNSKREEVGNPAILKDASFPRAEKRGFAGDTARALTRGSILALRRTIRSGSIVRTKPFLRLDKRTHQTLGADPLKRCKEKINSIATLSKRLLPARIANKRINSKPPKNQRQQR